MQRRLAAILLTDMVGYSRLVGLDEEGTIARQKTHREEIFLIHRSLNTTGASSSQPVTGCWSSFLVSSTP